jgi:hypothetical protein
MLSSLLLVPMSAVCMQGKKMATSLAGQAQEQMRKALAAREKASKAEKSA